MTAARKKKENNNFTATETFEFGAETGKILQLVIHSLYADKAIFLRELVSNSSDALDKFRYEALKDNNLEHGGQLKITLKPDEKNNTLTIMDNGIGMDRSDLIENLGTIARSGTQKFLEALSNDKKGDLSLIGQFGVGFYSAFMVADEITVTSQKAGDSTAWQWHSKADGKYTITQATEKHGNGTIIKLNLKPECKEFIDKHRISHIIHTYSDHISFPVELINEDGEIQVLNTGKALWAKQKSEITEEQYTEFYKHIAHAGDKPWMILHNKVEGNIQYTNLLFIPSVKPFDLFHPDRATRVRLYVKKVFISEQNIDLIPRHLRFLRGIVDSEDLPLNISRETLQHNHVLRKINESINKRVLGELKKKAEKEPEEFAKFWDNFGAILKEGLCEGIDVARDQLLEVCHFRTTKSGSKSISLDNYIKNMVEGQKGIYYLHGDNIDAIKNSPQLEGFIKKDIEVILLTDSVDDFWTTVNHEYKGKELVSINRTGLDIENLENSDKKKEASETKEFLENLIKSFKEILGNKVLNVVASKKLADSPVCLSVQEGAMDMRMERFLLSQNQLASASPKVLEININNPLVKYIGDYPKTERAKELALLLFDQACILEGESINNPGDFAKRLNKFLEGGL